jgi:serine protease Do
VLLILAASLAWALKPILLLFAIVILLAMVLNPIIASMERKGIGFAVPVNLARHIMERFIADGKVTRGYLGVKIQALTPELATQLELSGQTGTLVGEVTSNSPAEKAGLKKNDAIIEFDGKSVTDSRHLRLMVAEKPPGSNVSVKVFRDGKEQTFTVEFGTLPSEDLFQPGSLSDAWR